MSVARIIRMTVFSLLLISTHAYSLPIVSVDVDPLTSGIQTAKTLNLGDLLTVDVIIEGVEVTAPLNAFEFDLNFDPAILAATGVTDGGFLLPPVLQVEADTTAPDVNFAEVTLDATGATGSGILATITFNTLSAGTSALNLNDVVLSAPFGVPISTAAINSATVNVGSAAVPEPGTLILLLSGLIGLAGRYGRNMRA